jgi:flagellar motor switch/type III secretory pathway protein FliN
MQTSAALRRVPLSADLIKSSRRDYAHDLNIVRPFAEALTDDAAKHLSEICGLPVKVSLQGISAQRLPQDLLPEPGFNIRGAADILRCWQVADDISRRLLCDLLLGGNGEADAGETGAKPEGNIGSRLWALTAERTTAAAAEALDRLSGLSGLRVEARERLKARMAGEPPDCVKAKLLINVLDRHAEIELYLALAECIAMLSGATSTGSGQGEADPLQDILPCTLDVMLKPVRVEAGKIMELSCGAVLQLNLDAASPVELQLNGERLAIAEVIHGKSSSSVKILRHAPMELFGHGASMNRNAGLARSE